MPLGRRTDLVDSRFSGLSIPFTNDIIDSLDAASLVGFDFIISPITHPSYIIPPPQNQDKLSTGQLQPPFSKANVLVLPPSTTQFNSSVVGQMSPTVSSPSTSPTTREYIFTKEMSWAIHQSLQAVLLPPINLNLTTTNNNGNNNDEEMIISTTILDYGRLITSAVQTLTGMNLWLTIKAMDGCSNDHNNRNKAIWNTITTMCQYSPRLGVALELSPDFEYTTTAEEGEGDNNNSSGSTSSQHDVWFGEPLKAVLVPVSCFTINSKGYPVLPASHRQFLMKAFQKGVQVVLTEVDGVVDNNDGDDGSKEETTTTTTDNNNNNNSTTSTTTITKKLWPLPDLRSITTAVDASTGAPTAINHPLHTLWEYLSYLFRKIPPLGEDDVLELNYMDYLQHPLQPLQDNLESATYEVFERDTIKYTQYEEAVYQCLVDRQEKEKKDDIGNGNGNGNDNGNGLSTIVIMVVGAGRGPLVSASLRACSRANQQPAQIYAVEKNPNAIVNLQYRSEEEGWGSIPSTTVEIVHADMRHWKAPVKADIMVSELLGSWGDNELSPECLDGAMARNLAPDTGVSIPAGYTSYLQPITSHKLWNEVARYDDVEHFETPFVVKPHRFAALAPPQPIFSFSHPNNNNNSSMHGSGKHNERFSVTTFSTSSSSSSSTTSTENTCHGFMGYFDAVLYGDVTLSIHPDTHTPGMHSWFPIYFPIRHPFIIQQQSSNNDRDIKVAVWRCVGETKVWYEWAVQYGSTIMSPVHNPNGRSYYVGL